MTQALVKKFFAQWSIYNKVLAHHYRYHDDIYREVQHGIRRHSADRPFAVFDLGCGRALHLAHALENSPIGRYRGLHENGRLLLIDVMREEEEELGLYLARYCGWLRSAWQALLPDEQDAICDHIENDDFPETVSTLAAMATATGFDRGCELNLFRWHHTLCFEKSANA